MLDPQHLVIHTFPIGPVGGMQAGAMHSGVKIYHEPSGIGVLCHTERSQHANKEKALVMLELLLELEDWK